MNKKRSKKIQKKYDERKKNAKIASILEEQFQQGKLLGESLGALVWVWMRESSAVPEQMLFLLLGSCQAVSTSCDKVNCKVKAVGESSLSVCRCSGW